MEPFLDTGDVLKLIQFKNYPKKTPFAAEWDYIICEGNVKSIVDFDKIKNLILSKEAEVIQTYKYTHDWGTGLGADSMTSRSDSFNLLKLPEAAELKTAIRATYDKFLPELGLIPEDKIYVQCWSNVLRKGQDIKQHRHWFSNYAYLCGHICVQQENTNTYYVGPYADEAYPSANETGKITLFPAWLSHYTDRHDGNNERITIAFDIIPKVTLVENIMEHKHEHWVEL